MAYTGIPSNPFTVPGSAAGFLDIRKKGTTGPVVTVAVPAYSGSGSQPAAPTNLRQTSSTSSTNTMAWDAVAGTYTLQRAPTTNGVAGTFATVYTGTVASYQDTGLAFVTTYAYRVLVTVNNVASAYSAVVQATTAGQAVAPTITRFSPSSKRVGEAVTITGNNFTGATAVKFGTVSANFTVLSKTSINVTVPVGCPATCQLNVEKTGTTTATSQAIFTLDTSAATTTTLNNYAPSKGPVGTTVTLDGTMFGATQGTGTVKFRGQTATVVSWSDTEIVVQAPAGGTGKIVVTTNAGTTATSKSDFLVTLTGEYNVLSANYGEQIYGRLIGAIEESATFSTAVPTQTVQRTTAATLQQVYTDLNYKPAAADFGVQFRVEHGFDASVGGQRGGVQDFARFKFNFNNGDAIGIEQDAQYGSAAIYMRVNGTESRELARRNFPFQAPYDLWFQVMDRSIVISARIDYDFNAGGFNFKANEWYLFTSGLIGNGNISDFRLPATRASFTGVTLEVGSGGNPANSTYVISDLRYGSNKGVGFANWAPAKYSDGAPMANGLKTIIGYSVAGASAGNENVAIRTCHMQLGLLDFENKTLEPIAKIYDNRVLSDGQVYTVGENSVSFFYNLQDSQYYGFFGRWGTFSDPNETMGISYFTTSSFPQGNVVLTSQPLVLDSPYGGYTEDPDWVYYNGQYHFVYSTNNVPGFAVHYATSPNPTGPWTLKANLPPVAAVQEGNKFVFHNGDLCIVSTYAPGNGANSEARIYDLGQAAPGTGGNAATLTQIGVWTRQDFAESPAPTHPNQIPLRIVDNGTVYTDYPWVPFDGIMYNNCPFTWSPSLRVLFPDQRSTGYAYPVRPLPI